jgi:tripartite ATP-independent transporter DctP family solute receptor
LKHNIYHGHRFSLNKEDHMAKRLLVWVCVASLFFGSASVLFAKNITEGVIKLPHVGTEIDVVSSPYMALTETFKSIVEARTEGRFKVESYPNKQLGDMQDTMEQCARGMVWATASQNSGTLATVFPEVQALEIPYLFETTEVGLKVLNGPYGKDLNERIAQKTGLRMLAWLPSSFRNFSNNTRPIHTPADMEGLRIRCMTVPIHMTMVKSLGAAPTPISWSELYTALQTGVVDGQENAPYVVILGKLQEVQKYYSLDHHLLNIALFMMNEKIFQSLSPEDQWTMLHAGREAQLAFLGVIKATESIDLKTLAKSMKINAVSPANFAKFKAAAQPAVIEELKKKIDPKEIDTLFQAVKAAEKELGMQ